MTERRSTVATGVFLAALAAITVGAWWTGRWVLTAIPVGALFGFFAYATYDMTNYATLRNWSLMVVLFDMAWVTVLTGLSASIGHLGTRQMIQL